MSLKQLGTGNFTRAYFVNRKVCSIDEGFLHLKLYFIVIIHGREGKAEYKYGVEMMTFTFNDIAELYSVRFV